MNETRDYPSEEYRIEGREFRETLKMLTRTFFADVKRETGSYAYRGILWHAFSYGFQPALQRTAADDAVALCTDAAAYVFDEQSDMLWLCPRSIVLSDTHPCNDTYIFPATFGWLYITTHEHAQGVGPYFVRGG
ncbi:MAG: DUF4275 family protein [Planctomycetota bacterium]